MATPQEVQSAITKANKAYVEMNDSDILNVIDGCCGGVVNNITRCLYYAKTALQYRQDTGLYEDKYTDALISKINTLV